MASRKEKDKPNIAFVVAHPDDVAFGMGGTAWLLKDRYKLHVFCASRGERGYADPQNRKGLDKPPNAEIAATRSAEEAAACKLLGAELTFLGLIDGEIHAEPAAARNLAKSLADLKPAAMFTLWPINTPDHTATSDIATRAMRTAGIFHTSEIYFFEIGMGGATNQFIPDLYVNISDVIGHKRELIGCHKSHGPLAETIETYTRDNVMRGFLARCEYAEAFKTTDPVVNARWGRKAHYLLLDL
ncbi:MAG: PIG-L family deacetylase [Planctomycetes bacterium]|nr:PIG-L family deacetylase [Planctomycetota bacterium]